MLLSQLLALLVAAGVFLLIFGASRYVIKNVYMSRESVLARKAALYADFNGYVQQNRVIGSDTAAIERWARQQRSVSIVAYREEDLGQALPVLEEALSREYGRLYPMRFADGPYRIAISDSSEVSELWLTAMLALLLAGMAYIVIQAIYTGRLTRRIVTLSQEAAQVGAGDLEHAITMHGEDEISALAQDMDQMRRSVIERLGSERRAWEANAELITAISHDIRTPMTSLMGYLGLLRDGKPAEGEREQFTASAYDKAMELKDLTDELFRYFLVFGRVDLEMELEDFDARLLLEQLLGEAGFDLGELGFAVQREDFDGDCIVRADPLYLKRVLDNLVSNIKKYADRAEPVVIRSELRDSQLTLRLSNRIAARRDRVESTHIGLRTCEKIMAQLGGSFATSSDESSFTAELTLPAQSSAV